MHKVGQLLILYWAARSIKHQHLKEWYSTVIRDICVELKFEPNPIAARSKVWASGRSLAGIVRSNPAEGMDVCTVLPGRSLCDGPILCPEDSYLECFCVGVCVCVCVCVVQCDEVQQWPSTTTKVERGQTKKERNLRFDEKWM